MFSLRRALLAGAVVSACLAGIGEGRADPVDLLPGDADLAIYLKEFPSGLSETSVNLANTTNSQTATGTAGGTTVTFSSTSFLDAASGAATIKETNNGVYNDLTISVPEGWLFGDLIFGVQTNSTGTGQSALTDLTITAFNGATELGSLTLDQSTTPELKANADNNFLVLFELAVAAGQGITHVVLESISGINQTKQFEISGLLNCTGPTCVPGGGTGEVPIPGAFLLMGTVLAGGGGFAAWRRRRERAAS
jgi:LPXTG-motif cell wall-anchored protein